MGSIFIADFKFGMDRRRKRVAGTPGTLWTGENVVVTRGGDLERAKRFVPTYALPTGQTFGLAELRGQLWTFGSVGNPTIPLGVNYQQLVAPSGAAMSGILDARAAAGKLYVIAQFSDGNIFHYFDGARVTDWDTVAAGGFTYAVLADYFALLLSSDPDVQASSLNNTIIISARVPGTPFTIAKNTQNRGSVGDQDILLTTTQANVPAIAEARASTVVQILSGTRGSISSLKINGVELLWSSVSAPLVSVDPWNADVTYYKGQQVTYGSTVYSSFRDTNLNNAPSSVPTPWQALVSYNLDDQVLGSDFNVYSSLGSGNTGHDPTTDGGAHWLAQGPASWLVVGPAASIDLTVLAAALAQSINNLSAAHGYVATALGVAVTIQAAIGLGATPNGYAVVTTSSGTLNISAPALSGGVTAVPGVAQVMTAQIVGTPEALDLFILTINGKDYTVIGQAASTGTTAFVASRRIFSTAGSLVVWCALASLSPAAWSIATTYNLADTVLGSDGNIYSSLADSNTGHNPVGDAGVHWQSLGSATRAPQTIWIPYTNPDNAPIGAGFINVSNDAEGSERLVGIGRYLLNQMAAMTRRNIRLYNLSTDATQIGMVQPLDNTGALAARSILNFGSIDLFYLADSGIRSLRPRDTTNTAFMDDIGTAIDVFVRAQLDGISSAIYGRAVTVMEPRDDRFWLAIDDRIYVLSYFPSSQISAWTYFAPGFSVSDFARVYDTLYVRGGDTVYQYGGVSGSTYPNAGELISTVELPFAAETPPGRGMLTGFDQAAEGEWQVSVLVDPDNENALLNVGVIDHITYGEEDISIPGRATHFALNLTCSAAGYASISNIVMHTDAKETEI